MNISINKSPYVNSSDIYNINLDDVKNAIQKSYRRIKDFFKDELECVYLYGSFARGDYTTESDIDLFILTTRSKADIMRDLSNIHRLCGDIDLEYNVLISVSAENIDYFNKYKSVRALYKNIIKDGIEIYE